MTQQTTTRTTTFSATTSWVGVVLLGAGLTQVALPPSQATSPGPQTASVEYQGFDEYFGVLSGGVQRDFTSGQYGWQGPAFDALGMMGMEWERVSLRAVEFSPPCDADSLALAALPSTVGGVSTDLAIAR